MNNNQYRCFISNSQGSVTSNAVTLTVTSSNTAPSITTQPSNRNVVVGQNTAFFVTATGTPAPSFQWWGRTDSNHRKRS
jgi:hypothetical protein